LRSIHGTRALYAAVLEAGVLESTDAGRHWHRLGLAGEGVDALAISADGRVLYAGKDDEGVIAFDLPRQ
jgi:hypothetical protein